MTGFSLVPLQLFSMFGIVVSVAALGDLPRRDLAAPAAVRRRDGSPRCDRDILAFFLIGMMLFGLGLIGEYVGRIYQQVRERPRYMVRAVLESECAKDVRADRA